VRRNVKRRPCCTWKDPEAASALLLIEWGVDCHVPRANKLEVWRGRTLPSRVRLFRVKRTNPRSRVRPGPSTDGWADSTRPLTGAPPSTTILPSTVMGPETEAKNVSPARTCEMARELSRRTVISVPAGREYGPRRPAARKGVVVAVLPSSGKAGRALSSVACSGSGWKGRFGAVAGEFAPASVQ